MARRDSYTSSITVAEWKYGTYRVSQKKICPPLRLIAINNKKKLSFSNKVYMA